MQNLNSKILPSREIAYNYCAAMFVAQQMEDELRYILDSADYYGIIDEIELPENEKKKHCDSVVKFLDEATCGRLLLILRNRIHLPAESYWQTLETAIKDRNFLAHKFLVQFDYEELTKKEEEQIVHNIYDLFLRLWKAVQIVRALKKSLNEKTDRIDSSLDDLFGSKQPRNKTRRSKIGQPV